MPQSRRSRFLTRHRCGARCEPDREICQHCGRAAEMRGRVLLSYRSRVHWEVLEHGGNGLGWVIFWFDIPYFWLKVACLLCLSSRVSSQLPRPLFIVHIFYLLSICPRSVSVSPAYTGFECPYFGRPDFHSVNMSFMQIQKPVLLHVYAVSLIDQKEEKHLCSRYVSNVRLSFIQANSKSETVFLCRIEIVPSIMVRGNLAKWRSGARLFPAPTA